ncbi:MAG: hypothetical protein V4707_01405 [Pseudomonadota bacterium]
MIVWTIGLSLMALTGCAADPAPPNTIAQCAAAQAALDDVLTAGSKSDWFFIRDPEFQFRRFTTDDLSQQQTENHSGWLGSPPERATIEKLFAEPVGQMAVVCPEVAARAEASGAEFISSEALPPMRDSLTADGDFIYPRISIAAPVLNDAQTEALVPYWAYFSPESGLEALLLVRRQKDGSWRVVDQVGVSVS